MKTIAIILLMLPCLLMGQAPSPPQQAQPSPPPLKIRKVTKPKIFKTGARPRLQIGLQTGANFNYFIYNRNRTQKDLAAGYQGGVFFRVSRQKAFVQFEMNYLWSHVTIKNDFLTSEVGNIKFEQITFRYHTFGIPFIFGAYAVKKPIYKLRFYNGLEADFITRTRILIDASANEVYKLSRAQKRTVLHPAQFSYQLGMGMDIAMFVFDVKYNFALRSFYREEFRTQTHLFQLTVGAIF
jgi:hypothetical protein